MADTKSTTFVVEKATKNTYKFNEVTTAAGSELIGTLYVQKSAFDGREPKRIKLTVEVIE